MHYKRPIVHRAAQLYFRPVSQEEPVAGCCTMEAPDDTPSAYLGSFSQPSLPANTAQASFTCACLVHLQQTSYAGPHMTWVRMQTTSGACGES